MELITVIGLVGVLCYIARKMNTQIQKDRKETFEWEIACMQQYVKAVNYEPSCGEVLRYQRATGR